MPANEVDLRACRNCGSWDTSADTSAHSLVLCICCRACGHTTVIDAADEEVLSELANAIQAAVLVSGELRSTATFERADDADKLHTALRRVVAALQRLRLW